MELAPDVCQFPPEACCARAHDEDSAACKVRFSIPPTLHCIHANLWVKHLEVLKYSPNLWTREELSPRSHAPNEITTEDWIVGVSARLGSWTNLCIDEQ